MVHRHLFYVSLSNLHAGVGHWIVGALQFAGLQGDAVVTSEQSSNAQVWQIHYDAIAGGYTKTLIGNLPNQAEDAICVTAERLADLPEPASITLLAAGVGALGWFRRRGRRG